MPGNSFPFAIRVSRKIQITGAFDGGSDFLDLLLRTGIHLPFHGEIVIRAHRTVFRRQVTNMPIAGKDLKVFAQIFVDGFGLGRRLDDDDVHVVYQTSA